MAWTLPRILWEPLEGKRVKKEKTILVADRNPNVREFLRRELSAEGYGVKLARNRQELLGPLEACQGIDLLILDLDLPLGDDSLILEDIRARIPSLPVVIHAFPNEDVHYPSKLKNAAFVEKEGNSISRLKEVIGEILKASPHQEEDPQPSK